MNKKKKAEIAKAATEWAEAKAMAALQVEFGWGASVIAAEKAELDAKENFLRILNET